jgi:N-acetylmuramoyl-L-alanine amidase|tara:strand:+ start:9229 stop:9684 length:456 start_codon:yes stop_codon:yes gene_type:complete
MLEAAVLCLALNIYYEARSEPLVGKLAVAQVVINRVYDDRYPGAICEVVKQGPTYKSNPNLPIRNRCQFSWYCDGKSDEPVDKDSFNEAKTIANWLVTTHPKELVDLVEGATHYHATQVLPEWAASKTFVARIGNHIFYRWSRKEWVLDEG